MLNISEMKNLIEDVPSLRVGGLKVRKSRRPKRKGTTEASKYRALTAKKPSKSQPRIATLHISVFEGHTRWSLDYNVAEHLFKQKLEIIKNRIFLKYGYGNRFIRPDRSWQADKEVAYHIQQDVEWYNEQGIDVKFNL